MGRGTQEHRAASTLCLPKGNDCGLGSQEEIARRRNAEEGSARLLKAIHKYLERRGR